MPKYKTIEDLKRLSVQDFEDFLKHYWKTDEFTFVATFVSEKKEKSKRSGHFKNFRKKGDKVYLKYPLSTLFVSYTVSANKPLEEGDYLVPCQVIKSPSNYPFCLQIKLKSIQKIESTNKTTGTPIEKFGHKSQIRNNDSRYIELYKPKPMGWGTKQLSYLFGFYDGANKSFSKIWTRNFRKIDKYPNSDIPVCPLSVSSDKLISEQVYTFNWEFSNSSANIYDIIVARNSYFQHVDAKRLINIIYNDSMNNESREKDMTVSAVETIKKQVSGQDPCTFLYELLQNANDDPDGDFVEVEIRLTNNMLVFRHTGKQFTAPNVLGICGVGDGDKSDDKEAIGYKGIGFKNVFIRNGYVYIQTGDYSFSFDENTIGDSFMTTPKWEEYDQLDREIKDILAQNKDKFHVNIFMKPRTKKALFEEENNYKSLLHKAFDDIKQILFISHINKVSVMIEDEDTFVCSRDTSEASWVFSRKYPAQILQNLRTRINERLKEDTNRLPPKMENKQETFASFACQTKDNYIVVNEKETHIYCGLKAEKTKWGFPFEMNTDMAPTGPRDDIESGEFWNEEWANIAGVLFFKWMNDLIDDKKYNLSSIFRLVPNFELCKEQHGSYTKFIDKFQNGFEKELKEKVLIPIEFGKKNILSDTILDTTGFTSLGIITDEEFYRVTGYVISLPAKELRGNAEFEKVQKRYLEQFPKKEQIFTKENLLSLCDKTDFQKWLQKTEHNNAFLAFLINKEWLSDFKKKAIFLAENKDLYTADQIFFSIDKYKDDIAAFLHHIPYLSQDTRRYFNEKSLEEIKSILKVFVPKTFVDEVLLADVNIEQTKARLNCKTTSLHFYHFLATNVDFSQAYKDLPYINDEDMPVDSLNSDFIFVENEEGKLQTKAKWLEGIPFSFISADYGEDVLSYFKNTSIEGSDVSTPTFGVLDYDKSVIIEDVILSEKYAEKVNANQQKNDEVHKSFISFCYANKDAFNAGSLKQYAIKVNGKNKEGEIRYELTEANVFFETSLYDAALEHPWIGTDWMFSLSNDLLSAEISTDTEQLKKFYEDKFGVKDLTAQLFYDEIVSKNINAIFKATSKPTTENVDKETALSAIEAAKKCNVDFVSYLNDNVDLIYKDNDFTKFNRLALLDNNEEFIENDSITFFYDETLSNFISKAWLPSNIVNMCSETYRHSLALEKMQVNQIPRIKDYDFATLYNLVIVPNLIDTNQYLDDKGVNLDFHNSIIANIGAITPDDRKKISNAKVFIRGKEHPVVPASGHKIVSKTVEELVELSLVDYSELDLLDQDYHANEHSDYWREALGNDFFTIKDFQDWLINNKESVATKLQDKILNIKFWRWAKKNVKENLSYLSKLPILLKGKDVPCVLSGEIYFSDEYLNSPIENLVNAIAPNAPILTSAYIDFGEEKKSWVDFWTQLDVQQKEVEVLENVIRTRLSETKVPNLAELIYKNRSHLEDRFNNNLMEYLADIQLVGTDNQYRVAKDCVFVSISSDELNDEPFAYLSIPNLVTSLQAGVNSFIGEIIQKYNSAHYITDLNKWRREKIEAYLALQNENKQAEVHMSLIKDLAVLINANKDNLSALPKVGDIYLLDRDNTYKSCMNLTEGSKYHPFFDFEICGITLDYISDSYLSCGVSVMKLFNYMKVHHNLEENDLPKLSDYATACYFWKDYLGIKDKDRRGKNIKHVASFITNSKNPFKELVCIPTLGGTVVKAENLYSLRIKDKVALLTETDGEMLLPLDIIAEGVLVDENPANKEGEYFMDKLPFKEMLTVGHCFEALSNIPSDIKPSKEKELRKELVKWIVSQKSSMGSSLMEYRAGNYALWYNGVSQKQQITRLYALNPKDNLDQYFGNNDRIIDASYVANKDEQLEAFEVLGIKVISKSDVDTVPSADKKPANNSNGIKNYLKFYTLIISGIESPESWKNSYEEYCSKVDKMSFWTCSAIEKKYKGDGDVVKRLSGFYHEDGKDDFYYKDNLDSKLVFLDYVNGVKKYLEIKADIEIVKKVMDSKQTACDLIMAEYGRLLSDEEFVEEVRKTFPTFNLKDVIEPTTPTTMPESVTKSVTKSVNSTRTESANLPNVVEKQKEQEVNNEDSERTVHLSKADTNTLSQSEQIEAQLEAQKYLRSVKPMWKFPYNFAEVDEEGKPCCFSTFPITDEEGNNRDVVLKSYKRDDAPFSINPEEWDSIMNHKAKILIYRGNDIVEIEKEDLVKNQNSIILRFSTENLDVEDRISQFSDLLHYFKQIHFDFESFNVSKRAKSIIGITNKNQGRQIGNSDEDL